jgi:putative acetyltransferase
MIRVETAQDVAAVAAVERAAFGRSEEAELVDRLRTSGSPYVSLVADAGDAVVGHIFFSPVTIATAPPDLLPMGLAPMAVLPERQRSGIGGALIRAGLDSCRALGARAVVVLGHPAYYPRFGFVPAVRFGLRCEYDAPEEAFMALELMPGALRGVRGLVRFAPAFGESGVRSQE